MQSIWFETANLPRFNKLIGDKRCDVLIIGGGISGLLCAFELQKRNIDYILIEADRICSGVTSGTTAKITSQHGLIYNKLLRTYGKEKARAYLDANNQAVETYKSICKDIDCDFEICDSYVYSVNSFNKIDKEMRALEILGYASKYVDKLNLPIDTKCAVKFKNQAQFNPLKFLSIISEGLNIYENTRAISFDGYSIITDKGKITAENIVVATHFPIFNKHGLYFMKMYQHRSYVLALKNAPNVKGMYVDENKKGLSFRNYNEFLLLGGGSHKTGKKGGCWNELEAVKNEYIPDAEIVSRFAAQDCMTLDKIPYIGKYSLNSKLLYVATGFNKWGMTSSMLSAMLNADLITGVENEYTKVFSSSRSMLHRQLLVNACDTVNNLLAIKKPRCPHLGCALKWNSAERSWDCPCHGSRFDENGNLLDNPSNNNIML